MPGKRNIDGCKRLGQGEHLHIQYKLDTDFGPVEKGTDRGTSSSRGAKRRGDLYVNQGYCEM
ncbi:MAG: hypothetical protein KKH67_14595, partial [candidate division Zixibacteria bacterium]|nr:hypothetical protein [candidate division Zixibacteria bacterium]MBU1471347.1 hypothetical protein [candidate division Zixibacteria bacterium]